MDLKMKRLSLKIFLVLVVVFCVQCVPQNASPQDSRFEVRQKAQRVKESIQMKQAQGEDVSALVRKVRQARIAIRNGNLSKANRLLDEVLTALQSTGAPEMKTPSKSYSSGDRKKTVSLDLDVKSAKLVMLDPQYKIGKDIAGFDKALKVVPANVKGGKLTFEIGERPVFIVEGKLSLPLRSPKPSANSPFGFHPAKVEGMKDPYAYARDIGVSWTRMTRYFIWPLIQKDLRKRQYDWKFYDNEIREAQDFFILSNIIVAPPLTDKGSESAKRAGIDLKHYIRPNSYMPVDEKAYSDFVTACVERYDGDGVDDMPGLRRPIKYWQLGNEPHPKLKDFADFVKITSVAIKRADPDAQVVMGGALMQEMQNREIFDKHFLPILKDLGGKYIDVIDFHWGGDAFGSYRGNTDIYNHLRSSLPDMGFPKDMKIWITEMSGYSDNPVKLSFQPWDPQPQTESQHAADLVKKYVYGLSEGIGKIFWAWGMMEGFKNNDSYFDHTGLVYDGKLSDDKGRGVKKLAYYEYKLMAAVLEGSDWNDVRPAINGKDGVYAYRFTNRGSGRTVYVVWWDYFAEGGAGKTH
jgi:hypothetical protein